MSSRNQHWYVLAESRCWPLDETSTLTDDAGLPIPSGILVDLKVTWPQTGSAPRLAALASISVSPTLVSLVGVGVANPNRRSSQQGAAGDPGVVPLFSVTVPQPVDRYRMIPITPLFPGAAGWVVLGSGVTRDPYAGRFSSPQTQALLSPQAARRVSVAPVEGLGVDGSPELLTGLVKLSATAPFSLKKGTRSIYGQPREVILCSLDLTKISEREMAQLVGPCGRRPEADNCERPVVRTIAQVSPNCDGQITLDFESGGCIVASRHSDGHGITLDCGISLQQVCQPPSLESLPDAQGRLPNESKDNCDPNSEYFGQVVEMGGDAEPPSHPYFQVSAMDPRLQVTSGNASYMVTDPTDLRQKALWFSDTENLTTVLFEPSAIPAGFPLLWVMGFLPSRSVGSRRNVFLSVRSTDFTRVTLLIDWDANLLKVVRSPSGQPGVVLFQDDLPESLRRNPDRIFLAASLLPREGLSWFGIQVEGSAVYEGSVGPWDDRWQAAAWELGTFQSPLVLWDVQVQSLGL